MYCKCTPHCSATLLSLMEVTDPTWAIVIHMLCPFWNVLCPQPCLSILLAL